MNRKYSGFTLVEMLIVMGIIIILMAVGITAGRFAINRANDVAHQDAADKLFVATQSYMTDNREYPIVTNWETDLSTGGMLFDYLAKGEFQGGTDATFYYWSDTKSALVCVSLGGVGDVDQRGFYCTGTGINAEGAPVVDSKDIDANGTSCPAAGTWTLLQDWDNENKVFGTSTVTCTVTPSGTPG